MRLTKLPARLAGTVIASTDTRPVLAIPAGSTRNNRVCYCDGERFASEAERDYYLYLKWRQMAGEISDLRCHPPYTLQEPFRANGEAIRKIQYTPDFDYTINGKRVAIEVKGHETEAYRIRYRLFVKQYPDVALTVVKVERKGKRK